MGFDQENTALLQFPTPKNISGIHSPYDLRTNGFTEVVEAFITWRVNSHVSDKPEKHFQTVDVTLRVLPVTTAEHGPRGAQAVLIENQTRIELKASESTEFLASIARISANSSGKSVALKFILPTTDGYIARSDYLQQRLYGCPYVQQVESFVAPREKVQHFDLSLSGQRSFIKVLKSAVGIVVIENGTNSAIAAKRAYLERELTDRLSHPWILSQPIPERTLAILGHRSYYMMKRWFDGGRSMGIKVVVLGEKGSWLEKTENSHLIDDFIPIDLTIDQDLPSRVVAALDARGHKIDGITTTIDVYFDAMAKVSIALNLPTSPIEALAISQDKYATRTLFGNDTQNFLITSAEDLRQQLENSKSSLAYPLIVKPSKGWSSEGVFKVVNESELNTAILKLTIFAPNTKIIVESYVDGPEVDANFLMLDGEVLFFEVVDDFPSSADDEKSGETANFQELEMVYPSKVNQKEKELLRTRIQPFLRSIGFMTGIFHVEARIQNSSMEYTRVDGVQDLREKSQAPDKEPGVFILEVNVRCPGWMVIWATAYAYGVDYAAFQMLAAIGDSDRARLIAQPFASGPQTTVESIFVPTPRGGTLGPVNTCEELAIRRPDLMEHVVRMQTMAQAGETVPDPSSGTLSFVAAFNLAANATGVTREELLRIGQEIRQEVRIDIK